MKNRQTAKLKSPPNKLHIRYNIHAITNSCNYVFTKRSLSAKFTKYHPAKKPPIRYRVAKTLLTLNDIMIYNDDLYWLHTTYTSRVVLFNISLTIYTNVRHKQQD